MSRHCIQSQANCGHSFLPVHCSVISTDTTAVPFILEVSGVNWLKYFQALYQFSLMHRFVCRLKLVYVSKWNKQKTVNCIATVILVKMWRYVKFCTFFKNPLNCKIPALTAEWQCLYGPLSTCNCYLDTSQWKHFNCGCLAVCNVTTITISIGSRDPDHGEGNR